MSKKFRNVGASRTLMVRESTPGVGFDIIIAPDDPIESLRLFTARSDDAPALAQAILDAAGVTNALVLTDLPEVERKASGRWHEVDVAGTRYTVDLDETADEVREMGLAYLQIARWLEQNTDQPDPQVEKLARLVREAEDEHPENAMVDYERIARALIEAGVKVEVDE